MSVPADVDPRLEGMGLLTFHEAAPPPVPKMTPVHP